MIIMIASVPKTVKNEQGYRETRQLQQCGEENF